MINSDTNGFFCESINDNENNVKSPFKKINSDTNVYCNPTNDENSEKRHFKKIKLDQYLSDDSTDDYSDPTQQNNQIMEQLKPMEPIDSIKKKCDRCQENIIIVDVNEMLVNGKEYEGNIVCKDWEMCIERRMERLSNQNSLAKFYKLLSN